MKKTILPIAIIISSLIISLLSYDKLPDQVPIHWDISGEVDLYASKTFALFLLPAMMVFVVLLRIVAPKIDPKKENLQKNAGELSTINVVTLLVLLVVHGLTVLVGMGYEINIAVIAPLVAGVLFVVIGNLMPRVRHNFTVGIRTSWALANEDVWRKTNQIGGRSLFFGGLVMILSVFLSSPWMQIIFFVTLAISVLLPTISSFVYYKKFQSK